MAEFDISSQSVFSQQIQPQLPLESQGKNHKQIYSNINDEGRPNGSSSAVVATRKRKGRPPGAKNKEKQSTIITQESPNAIGAHLLEVQSGCDVFESLAAYTHKHQQGISVLSAVGRVTRVTLHDPTVAGAEILSLQGHFEIMSLLGTFLPPSIQEGATTLTVYLSGGQARVLGGNVVGPLIAYGPVMVIVAAFTFVACERLPLDINDQYVENEQKFPGDGVGGGVENSFLKFTSGLPFFGKGNPLLPVDMWTGEQTFYN